MSLKSEAIKRFLTAARSLVNQGMSKEAIMQFAKNEFGEITELFKKQIDNIFKKPASGIEKIKIKDEVFDDTVVKLPIDDTGQPFNPKNPMKEYGKPKKSVEERMENIKELSSKLDEILKERKETFKPKKTDDFNLSEDDPLGDLEKIIRGEGDTGLPKKPKKPRDEKYTGGLVDVEPSLSDIGHGSDALMARTRLMSPGSQMTTSTGLNYLLAEDNDNIRVPFAGGGSDRMMSNAEKEFDAYNKFRDQMDFKRFLEQRRREMEQDKKRHKEKTEGIAVAEGGRIGFSKGKLALKKLNEGRRKFMKAAGAGAAGIAALKTGLINLAKDAGPKVEAVKETVVQAPDYFFDLMRTIKMFGKEGTPIGERMNVTNYKNFELTEDITTGDMRITKQKGDPDAPGYSEEVMEYSKGGNPMEEGMTVERYDEATLFPDMDGKMKDIEDGIEPDSIKEIMEEVSEKITKKASGGLANLLGE